MNILSSVLSLSFFLFHFLIKASPNNVDPASAAASATCKAAKRPRTRDCSWNHENNAIWRELESHSPFSALNRKVSESARF